MILRQTRCGSEFLNMYKTLFLQDLMLKITDLAEVLDYAVKVDYWDVDAMADAIYGFVKYPALAKMFSEKGLEEVTGLKWNNAAAKIKAVYEDAINELAK